MHSILPPQALHSESRGLLFIVIAWFISELLVSPVSAQKSLTRIKVQVGNRTCTMLASLIIQTTIAHWWWSRTLTLRQLNAPALLVEKWSTISIARQKKVTVQLKRTELSHVSEQRTAKLIYTTKVKSTCEVSWTTAKHNFNKPSPTTSSRGTATDHK